MSRVSEERRTEATATAKLFVGRERELAAIEAALDDAAAGRGRLLMLAGEPGIGKTSLADRATAAAAARGFHAGWARCWEAGGAPAYWPWLDLLGELARLLDDAALARALGDGAAMLAELVPELRARVALAAEAIPPAEEGRFRLWRAAAALLREAAATRPMFIVLDDLHAADHSSLGLLHFVAHQLRRMRVVVLGTYRDVEARLDADTDELLARIRHEGTTLALGPLDRAAAVTLVRHRNPTLDQDAEARILDRTQGNPLFLEEMLRLRDEQGAEAIVAGEVPRGVRDAIRQRLNRVAGEARPLLDLAAVAGDEIDPALLAAASGRELGWVQARLAEVAEVGLVATRAGRRRFGHALFREVLERELGDEARRALHGSVLRALERRADAASALPSATYAELAHHALDGPPELLPRAVDLAIRAAQRAGEVLAYDDAIRLLEQARDAVQAAGSVPLLQARVLIALGEARIRRGEADAGQASCRAAFTLASAAQAPELGAAAALKYGQVFAFGVVDPVLVAMLEESLRALPPGDSPLRARLLARLAAAVQPSPDAEEPVRLAREAIAIARRVGDEATLLETLHDGISAVMDIAPPEEQRALNLEAEQLATRRGDRERLLRTHGRLALAHLALGELGPADTRVGAFERLAAELKAPWTAWRGFMLRAVRATMHGRFAEAAALGDEGLRVGRAAGDANVAKIWASNRAALLRAAERHDEMLAFEPAVQEMFARFGHAAAWQGASAALVHARVEDAERTRFHIDQLPEFLRPPYRNLFALFFIAEAAALAGPPELAAGIYERIRGLPDSYVVLGMSYMSWEGPSVRLLALLAAFLQRWDDATAHFEDALGCCRHLGTLPYLARTEYEYGRMLVARGASGDAGRARRLFASARATAERLQMAGLMRLIDGRLATIDCAGPAPAPSRAAPAADEAPFSLAPEGEYWTLATGGATFRLKDSLGLQYLARLVGEPGREIHVLDLVGGRADSGAEAGTEAVADRGDAGELIDAEARRSYERRLAVLRDALDDTEALGDTAAAARAQDEIDTLAQELRRAIGLGGRMRRAGGAAERARSAVQRRIRNALDRIGEHAPGLAAELCRTVKTGTFCVFRPTPMPDSPSGR